MIGANSIFTGDKLLTAGDDSDTALFAKLGGGGGEKVLLTGIGVMQKFGTVS